MGHGSPYAVVRFARRENRQSPRRAMRAQISGGGDDKSETRMRLCARCIGRRRRRLGEQKRRKGSHFGLFHIGGGDAWRRASRCRCSGLAGASSRGKEPSTLASYDEARHPDIFCASFSRRRRVAARCLRRVCLPSMHLRMH